MKKLTNAINNNFVFIAAVFIATCFIFPFMMIADWFAKAMCESENFQEKVMLTALSISTILFVSYGICSFLDDFIRLLISS